MDNNESVSNILKLNKVAIDDKLLDGTTKNISSLLGISDDIDGVNIINKLLYDIGNHIKSDNNNITDITDIIKQISKDLLKNKKEIDYLSNKFKNTFKSNSKIDGIVLDNVEDLTKGFKNNLQVVDRIYTDTDIKNQDGYEITKIKIKSERLPIIGDIFCSNQRSEKNIDYFENKKEIIENIDFDNNTIEI